MVISTIQWRCNEDECWAFTRMQEKRIGGISIKIHPKKGVSVAEEKRKRLILLREKEKEIRVSKETS